MSEAFICAYVRTPIGRFGGSLSSVRADDLGAVPLKALVERNPGVDFGAVDDVIFGCANQAGEDNRNVARMSLLLAGLPKEVPGTSFGSPASSSDMRATLRLSSPAWLAQPKITSSTAPKSTPAWRSSKAFSGTAPRSSARTADRDPPNRPIGVRT